MVQDKKDWVNAMKDIMVSNPKSSTSVNNLNVPITIDLDMSKNDDDQISDLKEQLRECRQSRNSCQTSLNDSNGMINNLQNLLSQAKRCDNETGNKNTDFVEDLNRLASDITNKLNENVKKSDLEPVLSEMSSKMDELLQGVVSSTSDASSDPEINALKREIDNLNRFLEIRTEEVRGLNNDLIERKDEVEILRKKLNKCEEDSISLKERVDFFEETIDSIIKQDIIPDDIQSQLEQIELLTTRVIKLKDENEELKTGLNPDSSELRLKLEQIEEKLEKKESELSACKIDVTDLEEKVLFLEDTVNSLLEKPGSFELKEQVGRLSDETEDLKKKHEKEIDIIQEESSKKLENLKSSFDGTKLELESELKTLKEISEKQISNLKDQKDRLIVCSKDLESKILEISSLKSEVESLKLLVDSNGLNSSEEITRLINEVEKLKEDHISEKKNIEEKRSSEIEKLELEFNGKEEDLESKVKSLKESSDKQLEELKIQEKTLKECQEKLISRDSEISSLKSKVGVLEKQIESSNLGSSDEIRELRNQLTKLNEDHNLEKLRIEASTLKEIETLKSKFKGSKSSLEGQVESLKTDMENEIKEREEKLKDCNDKLLEKEKKINEIENRISTLMSQIKIGKQLIETAKNDKSLIQSLNSIVQKKEEEIKTLRGKINEKDTRISELNREMDNIRNGINAEIQRLTDLDIENGEKLRKCNEKVQELSNSDSEDKQVIKLLNREKVNMQLAIERLRDLGVSEIESLLEKLSRKEFEISQLKLENTNKDSDIEKSIQDVSERDATITRLEQDVENALSNLGVNEEQLRKKIEEITRLTQSKEADKNTIESLKGELNRNLEELSNLGLSDIEDLRSKLSELEELRDTVTKQSNELRETIGVLNDIIVKGGETPRINEVVPMVNQVANIFIRFSQEQRDELSRLKSSIQSLEKKLKEVIIERDSLVNSNSQGNLQLGELQQQVSSLQQQLETTKIERDELEERLKKSNNAIRETNVALKTALESVKGDFKLPIFLSTITSASNIVNNDDITELKLKDLDLVSLISNRQILKTSDLNRILNSLGDTLDNLIENQPDLIGKIFQIFIDLASMKKFSKDRLNFYENAKEHLDLTEIISFNHSGVETRLNKGIIDSRIKHSKDILSIFNNIDESILGGNIESAFNHVKFDRDSTSSRQVRRRREESEDGENDRNVRERFRPPGINVSTNPSFANPPFVVRAATPLPVIPPLSSTNSQSRTPPFFPNVIEITKIEDIVKKQMNRLNLEEIDNFVDAKYAIGNIENRIILNKSKLVEFNPTLNNGFVRVTSIVKPEVNFEVKRLNNGNLKFVKDEISIISEIGTTRSTSTEMRGDVKFVSPENFPGNGGKVVTTIKISDTNLPNMLNLAHRSRNRLNAWDEFDIARIVFLLLLFKGIKFKGRVFIEPSSELVSSFKMSDL